MMWRHVTHNFVVQVGENVLDLGSLDTVLTLFNSNGTVGVGRGSRKGRNHGGHKGQSKDDRLEEEHTGASVNVFVCVWRVVCGKRDGWRTKERTSRGLVYIHHFLEDSREPCRRRPE